MINTDKINQPTTSVIFYSDDEFCDKIQKISTHNGISTHEALKWFFQSRGHFTTTHSSHNWQYSKMKNTLINERLSDNYANYIINKFREIEQQFISMK